MNARDTILTRVRDACADVAARERARVECTYARTSPWTGEELVDRFAERVADYRAGLRRCRADEVPAAIAGILAEHDARRVVVPAGVPVTWLPEDVERVADAALAASELDRLDGVLTGCALAIADTGTIVLDGGADQGRRALTLVPDLHVCVVEAQRIVGSVPEAVSALRNGATGHRRPLTFVSGPSATSDIELNRVEGVHGPRRLEVLIVG